MLQINFILTVKPSFYWYNCISFGWLRIWTSHQVCGLNLTFVLIAKVITLEFVSRHCYDISCSKVVVIWRSFRSFSVWLAYEETAVYHADVLFLRARRLGPRRVHGVFCAFELGLMLRRCKVGMVDHPVGWVKLLPHQLLRDHVGLVEGFINPWANTVLPAVKTVPAGTMYVLKLGLDVFSLVQLNCFMMLNRIAIDFDLICLWHE